MTSAAGLTARAALWHWVARCLWYPEVALLVALRDQAVQTELIRLAQATGAGVAEALGGLQRALAAEDGDGSRLLGEHTFLFARQVRVSPYETGYTLAPGADRAAALAELGAFYAAFGYQVAQDRPELPDHLSVEAAFLAALLAKEAYAAEQGWHARARLARRARSRFVRQHLDPCVPAFAARLAQHQRRPFYPAVARLALALLACELPASAPDRALATADR